MAKDYVPKPYQDIGAEFILENQRCALWAPPGFGKTAITLTVIDILKLAGSRFFPVLVIAPKQVCDTVWPTEVKQWNQFRDLTVSNIRGDARQRGVALHTKADIYCVNFENVEWLVEVCGPNWPFRTVVVDEATKLKGYRTKQGGKRAKALGSIAHKAGRFIELTGTPSPNGLKDLWGQLWFLDYGGRLGTSYNAFMQRWFVTEAYTRRIIPREGASAEIYRLIADCTLSLRPEDWFQLEKPIVSERHVRLPPEATKLYRQMERDFFIRLDEVDAEVTAQIALTLTTKLIQMASGGVLDDEKKSQVVHEQKLDALESLINESGGENIIVVYNYVHEAKMIQERFPHAVKFTSKKDEESWNAGNIPLLLLHPQRGGHGTNLQHGGRTMVFFSLTWDLELYEQVKERLGPVRQAQAGYKRSVLYHHIITLDTVDEQMLERLQGKRDVMNALMEARARRPS